MNSLFQTTPHRRFNALSGEWVVVSPHRTQRPWHGALESASQTDSRLPYDPNCYLCPGNARANGQRNPQYESTFAFDNNFPAFLPDAHLGNYEGSELLQAQGFAGRCRVLCFSPNHNLTLARMSEPELRKVVQLWITETNALSERWQWVQVFENNGELMGASNPHPHGQIWASDFLPTEPAKELKQQCAWFERHHSPLLIDYVRLEVEAQERLIAASLHWVAVIPWWAVWPFETLILPRRQVFKFADLSPAECDDLVVLLRQVLTPYDRLFDCSFPYSLGWHPAPKGVSADAGWQLHAHIKPPLLRSASVRKFMVGYEMFAEGQRDLTPEAAAARLREA